MGTSVALVPERYRTSYNKTYFRIFAFWDKTEKIETLVLVTHGIIKKIEKIPEKELEKSGNHFLKDWRLCGADLNYYWQMPK
jgi:hypothetical protein